MLQAKATRRRRILTWLAALLLAVLPWTWFGWRDAAADLGDMIAILLPLVVVGLVATALAVTTFSRRLCWLLPAASAALFGLTATIGPWLPADAGAVRPGAGISVLGANVRGVRSPLPAVLAEHPDVLVVSEVTESVDARLTDAYPYHAASFDVADYQEELDPQVGVYSRFPFRVLAEPSRDLPGFRVLIAAPSGQFVLYGLHIPRPWYTDRGPSFQVTVAEHHRIAAAVAAGIAAERTPAVLVGDLNTADRTRDYRLLLHAGGMIDAMRDGVTTYSSVGKWTALLLRIDHVMASAGWCGDGAHQVTLPGSDHRGVAVTVGPCIAPTGTVGSPS